MGQEWMAHINKCIEDLLRKSGKKAVDEHAAVWVPDSEAGTCMHCKKVQFILERRLWTSTQLCGCPTARQAHACTAKRFNSHWKEGCGRARSCVGARQRGRHMHALQKGSIHIGKSTPSLQKVWSCLLQCLQFKEVPSSCT